MLARYLLFPLFFAAMIAFVPAGPAMAEPETIYVFVNNNVPDSELTRMEIQNIYLGRKDRWSDNQRIIFTTLGQGRCQEAFISQYVQRTSTQFDNYWKRQIFTGQGQPPRSFASESDLIDHVSRTTGAVGYSCTPPDTGKVKVLTIN